MRAKTLVPLRIKRPGFWPPDVELLEFGKCEFTNQGKRSIGFTPDDAAAAGGYRKIRLTTRKKGLIVQARDGYYPGQRR